MADDSYRVELIITANGQGATATLGGVTQNLGRMDDAQKRAAQSGGTLENSFRRLQQAMELGIAGAALQKVKGIAEDMYELGSANRVTTSTFEELTGGGQAAVRMLDLLRDRTGGIINDFQLMQGASKYLSMGLGETQGEIATLIDMAVKLGGAMGNDATTSIENFALLLANESVLRLDTFGISSERVLTRMEELQASGQALNSSQAFRMAVMEEGANSLDRLGDAATAAETPLARLQTRVENIAAAFSSGFATGVDTLLALAEGLDTYTRARMDINERATMLFGDPGGQYINGHIEPVPFSPEQLRVAELSFMVEEQMRQAVTGAVTWVADEISRLAAEQAAIAANGGIPPETPEQAAWRRQTAYQTELNTMFGASRPYWDDYPIVRPDGYWSVGQSFNQQYMLPSEAEGLRAQADAYALRVEELQALLDDGLIDEATLEGFESMAQWAERTADEAERAAKAYQDLTLSQAFGEGARSPLIGDLSSQFLDFMRGMEMPEADFAKLEDTILLASGQVTEASIVFRDQVLPLVQAIFESQGAGAAAEALANLEQFLQEAALAGYTPEQIAAALPSQTGYVQYGSGAPGRTFTVNPGDTPGGIAAQYGMTLDELYAIIGTTNPYAMQPGTYTFGGGMGYVPADAFGNPAVYGFQPLIPGIGATATDAATATDPFKAMSDSTEKIAADIDLVAATLEDIGSKEYKVKLDLEAVGPAWLVRLLQMGNGYELIESVIQDNGGTTPGYNPRGTTRPYSG